MKQTKTQGAMPIKQHSMKCPKLYGKKCTCDGYHTFEELYDHRIALFAALSNFMLHNPESEMSLWKSKLHSDGTMFDGWFVAGIGVFKGEQITYHIPLKDWDLFKCDELGHAPEWDGHSPDEALRRLKLLSN